MHMAVAPLVGAWIEILYWRMPSGAVSSLLSWERGLKYSNLLTFNGETESLLSWERGLKLKPLQAILRRFLSLLSWERGLKYHY